MTILRHVFFGIYCKDVFVVIWVNQNDAIFESPFSKNHYFWYPFAKFHGSTPPKTNECPFFKGLCPYKNTSSNHWFSGDMLVFGGTSFFGIHYFSATIIFGYFWYPFVKFHGSNFFGGCPWTALWSSPPSLPRATPPWPLWPLRSWAVAPCGRRRPPAAGRTLSSSEVFGEGW